MGFDDFRVNIVLRLLALLTNIFILVWGYLNTDWQVTPLVCLAVLLLQSLEFVHYVELGNRQLTSFLDSIAERDFSTRFSGRNKGESFERLAEAYNRITGEFSRLNSDRAAKHQLLETLVEHISVALLCIDEKDRIVLMNRSAKQLFNYPFIQNAHALAKVNAELPGLIKSASPGESQLIRLQLQGELIPLSMFTTRFELIDSSYSLVSFQNIRDELEMRELDSWQKLIRVLTHEIMNSVTPIVSLTSVIKQMLVDEQGRLGRRQLNPAEAEDLLRSLLAIETRGKGLMRFVQSYNNLANPPRPSFRNVDVASLLERVSLLMLPQLESSGIALQTRCVPDRLNLYADAQQVEQVLINLLKNAREAMSGGSGNRIRISALKHPTRGVQISVSDNGPGIAQDKLQDIFIPFYTSKKDGSGVGLSISRQLMLANRGLLSVASTPGEGTEFTLTFRHQG